MLIPLLGFSSTGEPLLDETITGVEAASAPALECVRRLGLASPLVVCLPPELLTRAPSSALAELLRDTECVVGPFALERADEACQWLSAGAKYALFLPPAGETMVPLAEAIKAAAAEVAIPAERIVMLFDAPSVHDPAARERFAADVESLAAPQGAGCYEYCKKDTCGVVSGLAVVVPPGTPEAAEIMLLGLLGPLAARDRLQIFVGGLSSCAQPHGVGALHQTYSLHTLAVATLAEDARSKPQLASIPSGALPPVVELPTAAASLYALFAARPLELGPCVAACGRTDRSDGLYPTLVQEHEGVALGIVYSSAASIGAALRCGRGVYWSRSRQSLWRKGDTSGAWQTLRKIRLDCDSDALCFTVTQHGDPPAFCHKTTLSCWGAPTGLHALQLTLRSHLQTAPSKSYTKLLFDDAKLLHNKLLEEAQELAEATEPDHVAAKAADLLYLAMVRCVSAGVGLPEIASHLDRRALKLDRRPGNSKKERIASGDEILSKMADRAKSKAAVEEGTAQPRAQAAWMPVLAIGAYVAYCAIAARQ